MDKEKRVEFLGKWIKALRSGKYKQGTGCLCRAAPVKEYCCLGVACKVAKIRAIDNGRDQKVIHFEANGNKSMTSIRTLIPGLIDPLQESTLANMNDNGASFDQIADYIEKHILPKT